MHVLQSEAVDRDDDVHGLVLPANSATAVGAVVPEARTCCVQTGAVFLHYGARY